METLLKKAGFSCYHVFKYKFRDEDLAINMGFIAKKGGWNGPPASAADVENMVREFTDIISQRGALQITASSNNG